MKIFFAKLRCGYKVENACMEKVFSLRSSMNIYEAASDKELCLSGSTNIDNKFNLQIMEIREAIEEAAETQELHQIQEKV